MEIVAIDDDSLLLHTIKMVLEDDFGDILTLEHPKLLENQMNTYPIRVVILDLNFAIGTSDGEEGLFWVSKIKEQWKHVSIVVLTAHGFVDIAVRSLKLGAMDFVEKPFVNEKLVATISAALSLAQSKAQLLQVSSQKYRLVDHLNQSPSYVMGVSKAMTAIHELVLKVAKTDASVLITGEHGSGKEVIARLIHQESNRVSEPFVHVDLNAMTESLFASTLFGHAKGAFTDANKDSIGLVEAANLGTLFLDEIGELPPNQQAKLLVMLQNQQITRIGENQPRPVDLRLISATHIAADELIEGTTFRRDLFYRVNTVVIELPPLRSRLDDLNLLIDHFLELFNHKYNKKIKFSKADIAVMKKHTWPGNVRELKSTIERMVIMSESGNTIAQIQDFSNQKNADNLYDLEKQKIAEIIARHAGNLSHAAKELGIGRNTLYRKMKKYAL